MNDLLIRFQTVFSITRHISRLFLGSLMMISLVPLSGAQQVLEEIIVTAQKREQSKQDIGISITVFTGDQIRELGFTNSIDIINHTPGLVYGTPAAEGNNANLSLRGVSLSTIFDVSESPISVYVDEVYYGFIPGATFQLYDLERTEVLRGPQGTLFGRNATGGLLQFVTKQPTNHFEAYADLTYASHDQFKSEGAINVPITDSLFVRASFATDRYDGYVDNRFPGQEDPNDTDKIAGRFQALWQVNENLELRFNAHASEDDSNAGSWQHVSGTLTPDSTDSVLTPGVPGPFGYADTDGDPFAGDYDHIRPLKVENRGMWGKINWTLPNGWQLTSITAYEYFDRFYEEDTDMSPNSIIYASLVGESEQFTQELRLSGEANDDTVRWVGGFYYIDREVSDAGLNVALPFLPLPPPPPGATVNTHDISQQENDSWAVFGQAEWDFAEQFTFLAGVRYTEEDAELDFVSSVTPFFEDPVTPDDVIFTFNKGNFGDYAVQKGEFVDWKLELDWQPVEDVMLYASFSRGTKSAGFNPTNLGATDPSVLTFGKETLDAYEGGLKSEFWNNRVRFNASGFYYDYKDFQAFAFLAVGQQQVINSDAEISGFELELHTNPLEGFNIWLGLSVLADATVKDQLDILGVRRDRNMAFAPDYQVDGIIRYEWPMFGGTLGAQLDFVYSDGYFSDTQNFTSSMTDEYELWNGRLTYTSSDGNWEVSTFVQNMFDEEYSNFVFDFIIDVGFSQLSYGKPRWGGVNVRYSWGG